MDIGRILYWSYPRSAKSQCTLTLAFEALAQIGQPRSAASQQGNLTPKSGRHDDSRIQIFYAVHIALFFLFLFLFFFLLPKGFPLKNNACYHIMLGSVDLLVLIATIKRANSVKPVMCVRVCVRVPQLRRADNIICGTHSLLL